MTNLLLFFNVSLLLGRLSALRRFVGVCAALVTFLADGGKGIVGLQNLATKGEC